MTKGKQGFVDERQMSLLELLQQERTERQEQAPGRLCCSTRLKAAVAAAVKAAPKSREMLADEMAALTGQAVTVHNLNSWIAESHPHRLPAELLPALCQATGNTEPLRVLAETAGIYTLPGVDALRAEVQKLREDEQKISRERRRRELFLKELER
ncbi:hypothetical protein [Geoalkalibacter halelectricus]|uniref:hypothetical protein n=1 Tax=Geoalkalibacter halelectricus TaxID=2847045 RepID=UPI003D19F70A